MVTVTLRAQRLLRADQRSVDYAGSPVFFFTRDTLFAGMSALPHD
jgi:hypothetical protein